MLVAEAQLSYEAPVIVAVYYASGWNREWAFQNEERANEFIRRVLSLIDTTMSHIQRVTKRRARFSLN